MAEATLFRVTDEERRIAIELSNEKYEMYVECERNEARRQGLAEGRAEGRNLGLAEGREEGSYQAKLETAAYFKRLGIDIDKIVEGTGLSREKIESL